MIINPGTPDAPFAFRLHTDEGAVYTPWTDGWGVGFHVIAPGRPDRWVYLYPSQTDDLGESNVFLYNDGADPAREGASPVDTVCYETIWHDSPVPCDECGAPIPTTASSEDNDYHREHCSLYVEPIGTDTAPTGGGEDAAAPIVAGVFGGFTQDELEVLVRCAVGFYDGDDPEGLSERESALLERARDAVMAGFDGGLDR